MATQRTADRDVVTLGSRYLTRLGVDGADDLDRLESLWDAIPDEDRRGMGDYLGTHDRRTGDEWRAAFPVHLGALDNRSLRYVLRMLIEAGHAEGVVR